MATQNPPLYLQGANHPAEDFRHLISKTYGDREGVLGSSALAVTEKSGTANMSVDVAEGSVLVKGTEATYQGLYLCQTRGVTNLAVSASDPTNDRYDLIVAQVEDSDYSGGVDAWKLDVVTGTAAATPLFPSVPDNAFVLATVLVPASASSIVDADITDIRDGSDTDGTTTLINRGYAANPGVVVCTSSTRPSSPYLGMEIFETDTEYKRIYDGSGWSVLSGSKSGGTTNVSVSSSSAPGISSNTFTLDRGTWLVSCSFGYDFSLASSVTTYAALRKDATGGSLGTIEKTIIAGSASHQPVSGSFLITVPSDGSSYSLMHYRSDLNGTVLTERMVIACVAVGV